MSVPNDVNDESCRKLRQFLPSNTELMDHWIATEPSTRRIVRKRGRIRLIEMADKHIEQAYSFGLTVLRQGGDLQQACDIANRVVWGLE